jgi:microsomal dipeptidase-like Zn-dependent dipeptidase
MTSEALKPKGLTGFGKQVVRRMNKMVMMIDLSHAGEQTFYDVMKVTTTLYSYHIAVCMPFARCSGI